MYITPETEGTPSHSSD